MIRAITCGLRGPIEGVETVRAQMFAAHRYTNDLIAVERGRRWAMRRLHESSDAVQAAMTALRQATRETRRDALASLDRARREAERDTRCDGGHWAVPDDQVDDYTYSPLYEAERIKLLDQTLRRHARALTPCYWGTYLVVEAASDQARGEPLYQEDGLTPAEPHFRRLHVDGIGWPDGSIAMQLQGGLPTPDVLACTDTRVQLRLKPDPRNGARGAGQRYRRTGTLRVRVGSEGRAPVWATFPIVLSRAIPDQARWKWVRIHRRDEAGGFDRWWATISLELPDEVWWRQRDPSLKGAIAVFLEWAPCGDGTLRVARWLDDAGASGEIIVGEPVVGRAQKAAELRGLRDTLRNALVARSPAQMTGAMPPWLEAAKIVMHHWRAPGRFHELRRRWAREAPDVCPEALAELAQWCARDKHLHQYENGVRGQGLGRRLKLYQEIAARWSRTYRTVIVPDRDLTREARWGEDSDRRFLASPQELRDWLANAFGKDLVRAQWQGPHGLAVDGNDSPDWLRVTIERWRAGEDVEGARAAKKRRKNAEKTGSKWSRRKEKSRARGPEPEPAREGGSKSAE